MPLPGESKLTDRPCLASALSPFSEERLSDFACFSFSSKVGVQGLKVYGEQPKMLYIYHISFTIKIRVAGDELDR